MSKGIDKSFLRDISGYDNKIDATNPDNLSEVALSEKETRKRLLNHARLVGGEKDMMILFAKADTALRNCSNDKERADMKNMFIINVYRILGGGGQLFIDNKLVCDDSEK
jgi:hypothetical protein